MLLYRWSRIYSSWYCIFIANRKLKEAQENPEDYDQNSVKAMNTAKIVALVILIINSLYFLYYIYMLSTGGYDEILERFNEAMEQVQQNQ